MRQIIVLPKDFQETLIVKEMKFNNGDRSINLIRELLYLYMVYFIINRDRYGIL